LDKTLAKKTDKILFAKIENDGFDLGAQRRPIKQNDLPGVFRKLTEYRDKLMLGEDVDVEDDTLVSLVEKEKIAENGEYNLSGERYKEQLKIDSNFPIVELKEVAEVISGQSPKSEFYNEKGDGLPFYQGKTDFGEQFIEAPTKWTTEITKEAFKNDILMSVRAPVGPVNYATQHICIGRGLAAIRVKQYIKNEFLFYLLKSKEKEIKGNDGAVFDSISRKQIEEIKIPLPPLSVQEEIVAEIESYQKIIDGARQVVENYKPKIDIDPDWEMVELGEVCEINPKKSEVKDLYDSIKVSFVPMADLNENQIDFNPKEIRSLSDVYKGYTYFKNDDVLLAKVTPCFENGKAGIARNLKNGIGFGSSEYFVIRPNDKILSTWIYLNIITNSFREKGKLNMTGTGGLQRVPLDFLKSTEIPLPHIEIQKQIVAQIEKEQELVNANKQLIEIYEQKIKDRIAKVWGE
jgi:type I restriction enzyme M protein